MMLAGWLAAGVLLPAAIALLALMRRRNAALAAECRALRERLRADPLTGVMSRSAFDAALDAIGGDSADMVVALVFDLDRFRAVNDTLGHKVGDALLRQVAARATETLPPETLLARLGGDEFAALLAWRYDVLPEALGERIREALMRPFAVDGHAVEVEASVGVAIGDPTMVDGHELLRRADIAMAAAKASDDARCRIFDDKLDRDETLASSVRVEVGKAMIEDMLRLHYQPLVDARSGEIDSAEALLRAQAPSLRDVSPAALIATAEASGQIHALTDWSIDCALAAAKAFEVAPIAVNISPVYFRRPEFVHDLLDRLLAFQVRPEKLILEVTEGVLMDNLDAAQRALSRLREVGVRIHLDDFGTGYSSLSYIQSLELDGLKLDKSFLRNIGDKRKTTQIIRSMIDFGHSLDLRVVVEGVEDDWQMRLLQLLGADVLQGYEIAMPMPLDELIAFRDSYTPPRRAAAPEPRTALAMTAAG